MNFLLEIGSEEIPARMQAAAAEQLRSRFVEALKAAALAHGEVVADATPRRLWLIAHDLAAASEAASEERRGPKADAPAPAIEGFLRSTGLARDQLEERADAKGRFLYAVIRSEGRPAAAILSALLPEIVRGFQWPKSMRWGAASASTASPRWVRPLTGFVALLDAEVVPFEAHGLASGRTTTGHRIHAPGVLSIDSADSYAGQLRAAHVIASSADRRAAIESGATQLAAAAGLAIIPDDALVAENAGLAEWPVALLGRFAPDFLAVPREVIQLTMRTNQKFFACADTGGALAPAFVCIANLEASDGGAAVVKGNERVLSARLSDAKFFWDQDVAAVSAPGGLEVFRPKLESIVFHEKLGTMADKVERVAKLARWLVESGAVAPLPLAEGAGGGWSGTGVVASEPTPDPSRKREGSSLADLAERAARLAKADLVSATVGEFPEVQGIAGAYLARLSGEDPAVADAIRDHYKPVGQGDDVPTAPVSVAVALADKLDTLVGFFAIEEIPTGSRDPFALRRQILGVTSIINVSGIRLYLSTAFASSLFILIQQVLIEMNAESKEVLEAAENLQAWAKTRTLANSLGVSRFVAIAPSVSSDKLIGLRSIVERYTTPEQAIELILKLSRFAVDRLKLQQRDAGVRHDLIDAVFALTGDDDLVRLLARVRALQAFIVTDDGANLLAGYKRAANILKIEGAKAPLPPAGGAGGGEPLAANAGAREYDPTPGPSRRRERSSEEEAALAAALDAALPAAAAAVAAEDFTAAMTALASLRAPVDAFFDTVMVNDPDPHVRARRLALLARFRDAVHTVADFGKIV